MVPPEPALLRRWGQRDRPLVIAHRGASAERIENTVPAFLRAREQGADGWELDVMRCATGEVVVFHDDELGRHGRGVAGAVRELPWRALAEVDLGGGARIPTLDQILALLGPAELIDIELKSKSRHGLASLGVLRDDGLPGEVARLIERHGVGERALVTSFDPFLLRRFRRAAPSVATGLLLAAASSLPLRQGWAAPLLSPEAILPEASLVEARTLRRLRRAGRAVAVWTVDDPREAACLAALGVDGLITNRPEVVRRAIDDFTARAEGSP